MIELEPIGYVRTPFETPGEAPRQGSWDEVEGTIHVEEAYVEGLDGIEAGQKLVVIWYADGADRSLLTVEKRRGQGVFHSRSQSRPNPICLTTCTVLSVDGGEIRVEGVDMRDQSPVLDLKPPIGDRNRPSHD